MAGGLSRLVRRTVTAADSAAASQPPAGAGWPNRVLPPLKHGSKCLSPQETCSGNLAGTGSIGRHVTSTGALGTAGLRIGLSCTSGITATFGIRGPLIFLHPPL